MPAIDHAPVVLREFGDGDIGVVLSAAADPLIPLITTVPAGGGPADALAYIERQRPGPRRRTRTCRHPRSVATRPGADPPLCTAWGFSALIGGRRAEQVVMAPAGGAGYPTPLILSASMMISSRL